MDIILTRNQLKLDYQLKPRKHPFLACTPKDVLRKGNAEDGVFKSSQMY